MPPRSTASAAPDSSPAVAVSAATPSRADRFFLAAGLVAGAWCLTGLWWHRPLAVLLDAGVTIPFITPVVVVFATETPPMSLLLSIQTLMLICIGSVTGSLAGIFGWYRAYLGVVVLTLGVALPGLLIDPGLWRSMAGLLVVGVLGLVALGVSDRSKADSAISESRRDDPEPDGASSDSSAPAVTPGGDPAARS